jgi:predicted mannosyl-3-phosphoglycerate phosphatase (HAD superfamily)
MATNRRGYHNIYVDIDEAVIVDDYEGDPSMPVMLRLLAERIYEEGFGEE